MVFVMPRCRHDNVRGVHKQACSLQHVDPRSFDDIVAARLRLTLDRILRERMGEAGKYYVVTEFNWGLISEPFLDLVAGMLGKKRRLEAQQ